MHLEKLFSLVRGSLIIDDLVSYVKKEYHTCDIGFAFVSPGIDDYGLPFNILT